MNHVVITGTGSALPARVISNAWFESIVDTNDEWITTRTGIKERRWIEPGQAMSDLAIPAAKNALDMARVDPADLDLIIMGTVTADMVSPSCSCLVQNAIGARRAVAFDVNAACPGFIYGLTVAQKFMRDGSYQKVLVLGGDIVSQRSDFQDRATCVLFGDGAGAVVLETAPESESRGILSTHLGSDGSLWELLYVPGGGSRIPPSPEMANQRLGFVKMRGNEVFKYAVGLMADSCNRTLAQNNLTPEQVDLLIPHQANLRIIEAVGKKLGVPLDRVFLTVHKYGNTSAATIPTALDEAMRAGRIQPGHHVLCCSFGAGFTWGSALIRF